MTPRQKKLAKRFPRDRRYLEETTRIRVRFSEIDSIGVVWHGHYFTYFEDAREVFGKKYGLDYSVFLAQDVAAPVVNMWIDFLAPARMDDVLEVTARLYESEGAKLEFCYEVRREGEKRLLVAGGTVQVFVNKDGDLILKRPDFLERLYEKWRDTWLSPGE